MEGDKKWSTYCCNPYKKKGHWVKNNLRRVTENMVSLNYGIERHMKICTSCRLQLGKEKFPNPEHNMQPSSAEDIQPGCSGETMFVDRNVALEHLNVSLSSLGESPVSKKKMHSSKYCTEKMGKIKTTFKQSLFNVEDDDDDNSRNNNAESEIIEQLKDKFKLAKRNEKLQILTVLPRSWSCSRIEKEFGVTNYFARKAKALQKDKGVLSTADPKPGKTLDEETVLEVKGFYCSDDVSRIMPGKKDYTSIKNNDGIRIQVQKRLILGNLREIYEAFKTKYPLQKIGFSKFADLRPKNCVIAGGSGTHVVCVCTIHQNVKLMIAGGNLNTIILQGHAKPLKTYHDCLEKIMCNPPGQRCYLDECDLCPSISDFKEALLTSFEEEIIENVTYKQWVSVDRCTFETFCKSSQDFVEEFSIQLKTLKRHDFVAKQQSAFFSDKKITLNSNEAVVTCDFAENYSFVLQDEAQSFHWNNSMATVHPFVVYYKDNDEVRHKSFVCISECLKHDTILVHVFQRKLIHYLKEQMLPNLTKIFYFSDGSAAQYKNRKNFANLCHHRNDFDGINAEWHFYATAHGKGVCDGVGGTVKRLAAKASLQNPLSNQIMTPTQLFEWGRKNINAIVFFYVTNGEYLQEEKLLQKRFEEAVAVTGTLKLHCFLPVSTEKVETRVFSASEESVVHRVRVQTEVNDVLLEEIIGFVACAYDNSWWLGCVLSTDEVEREVSISFLQPAGPATSFSYPRKPDVLSVPVNFVLCRVDPSTVTGRTYTLTETEMECATKILAMKSKSLYM